jgi:hypothetical protein
MKTDILEELFEGLPEPEKEIRVILAWIAHGYRDCHDLATSQAIYPLHVSSVLTEGTTAFVIALGSAKTPWYFFVPIRDGRVVDLVCLRDVKGRYRTIDGRKRKGADWAYWLRATQEYLASLGLVAPISDGDGGEA